MRTAKSLIRALLQQEQQQYEQSQMVKYIDQTILRPPANQSRMINSILQRQQQRIIIDRVKIDDESITDPELRMTYKGDPKENHVFVDSLK
jgi:hypothetical protein